MPQPGAAERQWQCQQQLLQFFHLLDAKRYDDLVALFAEGGVWARPGAVMNGRAEIAEAMRQRPADRLTRHLVSNFLVLGDGGASVDAVAHLTTYAFEAGKEPSGPMGIFTAKVRFQCEPEKTWIAKLELAREFKLAG